MRLKVDFIVSCCDTGQSCKGLVAESDCQYYAQGHIFVQWSTSPVFHFFNDFIFFMTLYFLWFYIFMTLYLNLISFCIHWCWYCVTVITYGRWTNLSSNPRNIFTHNIMFTKYMIITKYSLSRLFEFNTEGLTNFEYKFKKILNVYSYCITRCFF